MQFESTETFCHTIDIVIVSFLSDFWAQNICYKMFKTIQHIKTWYSSKTFLSDFETFYLKVYIKKS